MPKNITLPNLAMMARKPTFANTFPATNPPIVQAATSSNLGSNYGLDKNNSFLSLFSANIGLSVDKNRVQTFHCSLFSSISIKYLR